MFAGIRKYIQILVLLSRKHKKQLVIGIIFLLLSTLMEFPAPLLAKYLIDSVLVTGDLYQFSLLLLAMFVSTILFQVFYYWQKIHLCKYNESIIADIKVRIHSSIIQQSVFGGGEKDLGYLAARCDTEPENVRGMLSNAYEVILKDSITGIIAIIIMLKMDALLTLLLLCVMPIYVVNLIFHTKRIKKINLEYIENRSQASKIITENISGRKAIQAYEAYRYGNERMQIKLKKVLDSIDRYFRVTTLATSTDGIINWFLPGVIYAYGGYQVIQGESTVGTLIAFMAISAKVIGPVRRFMHSNINIQKGMVAYERIQDIVNSDDRRRAVISVDHNINLVEFRKVSSSYGDGRFELKDVNITLRKGIVNIITGPSGAGKSTIIHLLLGYITPTDGDILIDGINAKELSAGSKNSRGIGYIDQKPFMFNASVEENIKIGRSYSKEDVITAAKLAGADEFVSEMPEGYDTYVGEDGTSLSLGQKQRIAIARALVGKPNMLVFDEATSNLDREAEEVVHNTIISLIDRIIVVMVTHKTSEIKLGGQVIVIKNGVIEVNDEIH